MEDKPMDEEKRGVSINGFQLDNLRTLRGPDGSILRADLLFHGRKICEYFDEGDEKPYLAYPVSGYTIVGIEKAVTSFTKDIRTLVDEIVNRTCVLDSCRKAARKNKVLVWMRSEESGIYVMSPADPAQSDDEAISKLRGDLEKMYPDITDGVYEVIRDEEDLNVNDMGVIL